MVTYLGQTVLDQWSLATKMNLVGDGDGDAQQAIASLNGGTGVDTLKRDGAGNGVSGEAPASEAGEVERLLALGVATRQAGEHEAAAATYAQGAASFAVPSQAPPTRAGLASPKMPTSAGMPTWPIKSLPISRIES
jgi:hypothetical protein